LKKAPTIDHRSVYAMNFYRFLSGKSKFVGDKNVNCRMQSRFYGASNIPNFPINLGCISTARHVIVNDRGTKPLVATTAEQLLTRLSNAIISAK
jgi:hypothetical protein